MDENIGNENDQTGKIAHKSNSITMSEQVSTIPVAQKKRPREEERCGEEPQFKRSYEETRQKYRDVKALLLPNVYLNAWNASVLNVSASTLANLHINDIRRLIIADEASFKRYDEQRPKFEKWCEAEKQAFDFVLTTLEVPLPSNDVDLNYIVWRFVRIILQDLFYLGADSTTKIPLENQLNNIKVFLPKEIQAHVFLSTPGDMVVTHMLNQHVKGVLTHYVDLRDDALRQVIYDQMYCILNELR